MNALSPLDDPTYGPIHKPENGRPPAIIAKWGPASQLRWFDRFSRDLTPMRVEEWAPFYCSSREHRGLCCSSCQQDQWDGYGYSDSCCCLARDTDET